MEDEKTKIGNEIKEFISKIERLNNRTAFKLKELKKLLQQYDLFRNDKIINIKPDIFFVIDLIERIDSYLNRKRLGKKTENYVFKEVKEIALIRLNNTKDHFNNNYQNPD